MTRLLIESSSDQANMSQVICDKFDQILAKATSRIGFDVVECESIIDDLTFIDDMRSDLSPLTNDRTFRCVLRNMDEVTRSDSVKHEEFFLTDTTQPSLIRLIDRSHYLVVYGLASIYRNIVKIAVRLNTSPKLRFLLGFRNNCLKACSEASKWTNLCENESIRVYNTTISEQDNKELRSNYFRSLESILSQPLKLANLNRKLNRERENASMPLSIRFLEDRFVCISDLIVYYFLGRMLNESSEVRDQLETAYPSLCAWYNRMLDDDSTLQSTPNYRRMTLQYKGTSSSIVEQLEDDLSRQLNLTNTNENMINENDEYDDEINIDLLMYELKHRINDKFGIEIPFVTPDKLAYVYDDIRLDWPNMKAALSPAAGGLPTRRLPRKCEQLENFVYVFGKHIYPTYQQAGRRPIVCDFCSGGGHLGILLAYMFPECIVKLIENKEESLEMAMRRVCELELANCFIYKGNLTGFRGHFDVGIGMHACGSATDLIIEKCVANRADVLIAPCCYGSIKPNERLSYPRSFQFRSLIGPSTTYPNNNTTNSSHPDNSYPLAYYSHLTSHADRTERNIAYEQSAYLAMSMVDTDRLMHLREKLYRQTHLLKLKPETCSTKNNLLLALA